MTRQPSGGDPISKREIDWKLTLHQIGWQLINLTHMLMFYIAFSLSDSNWKEPTCMNLFVGLCLHVYTYIWLLVRIFCPFQMCLSALIFLLGLDVLRTDRTLVFYEKQENLSKLWDILAVYSWFDGDVGYCQGGSNFTHSPFCIFSSSAICIVLFINYLSR